MAFFLAWHHSFTILPEGLHEFYFGDVSKLDGIITQNAARFLEGKRTCDTH